MKKICIYGKGGIGKSTVVANVAAAAAKAGHKVMVVGCDPKADTTRVLMHGCMETILDIHARMGGVGLRFEDIAKQGAFGVLCLESGGPRAGEGCAGKGIALALQDIQEMKVIERFQPELILYDVLGDVVCGGFSTPLRAKVADLAYIVTTLDYMSIYAANNICGCIRKHAGRGGCRLGGLIFNERSALSDRELVETFAEGVGSRIVSVIPQDRGISASELRRMTAVEYLPDSKAAKAFGTLAEFMLENEESSIPNVMSGEALENIGDEIAKRLLAEAQG